MQFQVKIAQQQFKAFEFFFLRWVVNPKDAGQVTGSEVIRHHFVGQDHGFLNHTVAKETLLIKSGEVSCPQVELTEPLLLQCQEFIKCVEERRQPVSDASLGLKVVETLEALQQLLEGGK